LAQRAAAEHLVRAIASTVDAVHLVAERTSGEPPR